MTFTATQALTDAALVGGYQAALDDSGTDGAYAIIKEGTTALVTMVFARPATTFVAHELVFEQGEPSGDMIFAQGDADNFELYSGAGVFLGAGDVTEEGGGGAMEISGTAVGTTRLYAGARAVLALLKFT